MTELLPCYCHDEESVYCPRHTPLPGEQEPHLIRNVTEERGDPQRFHLYRLCDCTTCEAKGRVWMVTRPSIQCPDCRGEGRTRELVATATDPESLGVVLVTLGREGEWKDCPIGILDTEGATGEKWLVRPWLPSARNVSDAGRTLARSKGKK